jgi:hypothetical protein
MLIISLIRFDIFLQLQNKSFKIFYLLPILKLFVRKIFGKGLYISLLKFFIKKRKILFIKFKVCLDKLHKK